jgi:hypothetical protein
VLHDEQAHGIPTLAAALANAAAAPAMVMTRETAGNRCAA